VVKTNYKILFTFLISIVLVSNIVFATPGIPNAFYGSVTWNGSPAPDGTAVVAKINGVQVSSTTTTGGNYGYNPVFYVSDPNNNLCAGGCPTVSFFVNDVDTGKTSIFGNGYVTLVDLSATGGQQQQGGSPGGGGGGGGGIVPPKTTDNQTQTNQSTETQQPQACYEKWNCTEWSECKDRIQTRTCKDDANCGTFNNQPMLSQPCSPGEQITKPSVEGLGPTAFFLALTQTEWAVAIAIGVIVAIVVIFVLRKRSYKSK